MTPDREVCIEVPGARLAARSAGEATGGRRAIVLLHGWAMDQRLFEFQIEALARHFHVVTWDRRGCGRSTGTPALGAALDDLDAVAGTLIGDEPFHLLGMSQGGRVALRYAAAHPRRIRSLLLQGPGVDGITEQGPAEERIPVAQFTRLARHGDLAALRASWLRHPLMRLDATQGAAADLVRRMVDDYRGADLLHPDPGPPPAADVVAAVAAAGIPVLLLTGARETASRRRVAGQLLARLPDCREVEFAASGHLANLTEPGAYNAAVVDFCREVDDRRERRAPGESA